MLQGQALNLGLQVVRQVVKLLQAILLSAETPSEWLVRSVAWKACPYNRYPTKSPLHLIIGMMPCLCEYFQRRLDAIACELQLQSLKPMQRRAGLAFWRWRWSCWLRAFLARAAASF